MKIEFRWREADDYDFGGGKSVFGIRPRYYGERDYFVLQVRFGEYHGDDKDADEPTWIGTDWGDVVQKESP